MKFPFLALIAAATLAATHAQTITVLKNCSSADGQNPTAPPILASNGKIYGGADGGGANGDGVIFRVNANGGSYGSIFDFTSASNGAGVGGKILEASDGLLYGACEIGGANDGGTLWRIDKNGANFLLLWALTTNSDGKNASDGLIEASDGKLYGTCRIGGGTNEGTIFRINKNGTGFQVIHTFAAASDGKNPRGGLIVGSDGMLYGITENGGNFTYGTAFRINKDGTGFQVIRHFDTADGFGNTGGLTQVGTRLLGAAQLGGANGNGTIWRMNLDGSSFVVTYDFGNFPNPYSPKTRLVPGGDGYLYGTTSLGGENNNGVIYRVTTSGTGFKTLAPFKANTSGSNANALTLAARNTFLGSAVFGGATDNGTIFRFTLPTPAVTVTGKKKITIGASSITLKGTAKNAAKVEVKVGNAAYKKAKGASKWSFKARLKLGKNIIVIRAVDSGGGTSKPVKVIVIRK